MLVETTRFGSINVDDNDILRFPEGMLGFAKIDQYVLVESEDDSLFLWLQAVKKPSIAFPLLEPQIFERQYKVDLLEEDRKVLEIEDLSNVKIFSIVTIPTDPTKMTVNLKAPIVVNLKKRLAKQVILHEADYPIRKQIFTELQQYCAASHRVVFPVNEPTSYHTIQIKEEIEKSI
jgi:flagellar assembly factor FliW